MIYIYIYIYIYNYLLVQFYHNCLLLIFFIFKKTMNSQKHAKLSLMSSTVYTVAVRIIQSEHVWITFFEGYFWNKIGRTSSQ